MEKTIGELKSYKSMLETLIEKDVINKQLIPDVLLNDYEKLCIDIKMAECIQSRADIKIIIDKLVIL